jgi:hypothetical protein
MQHKPTVVDAPTNTLADPLNRIRQARAKHGIEVPDPRTDVETPRPPDLSDIAGLPPTSPEAKTKTLTGNDETAAIVGRIQRASVQQAFVLAIVEAKRLNVKASNNEELGGFDSSGTFVATPGQQRCLRFMQFLLHHPELTKYRGNGLGLVRSLASAGRMLMELCNRLGCDECDVRLAGDKVRLLAGESVLDAAVSRMSGIKFPGWVGAEVENMPRVQAVVRLVAALAEVTSTPTVFLSGTDAARALKRDAGGVRDALVLAVDLGVIELVEKGHRRNAKAKGKASTYYVAWSTAASSNRPGSV